MRVVVIGATGVLGRNLIPLLIGKHDVRVIARDSRRATELFGSDVAVVQGDLLDPQIAERLPTLLLGAEAVLHLATAIPSDPSAPGAWEANTLIRTVGTRNLIDGALAVGARYYIQQSIAFAYADHGDEWIDETTPLDESAARAPLKKMEAMVEALPPEKMGWCILRGGVFVGPGTFQEGTIERLKAGKETVPCDGRYFVPYVHVADMASAVVATLEHLPARGIYHIVDVPVRQGEYLDQLASIIGAAMPPRKQDVPCPPSHRSSNEAASRDLGWSPVRGIYPVGEVE
jgi:nucleoside-diphosphate-sugar epimerase